MDSAEPKPEEEKPAEGAEPAAPSEATPAKAPVDDENSLNQEMPETDKVSNSHDEGPAPKKKSGGIKALLKKFNIYLLVFVFIVIVAGAVTAISYFNGKKAAEVPKVATQELTADALKKLATTDASVGNSSQTLTVQGNAIFSGQVLVRGSLNVAGTIQLGSTLSVPSLNVSGATSLNDTQISKLQVQGDTELQGTVNIKDLNVSGTTSFGNNVTASQITVTRLILSGNAVLQVPNHLAFTGATPGRTIDTTVLGSGGTASISGSDVSGSVNINSGNGAVAGCWVKITFAQPFAIAPHIIISPVGLGAATSQYYVTKTTTGFSICTANAPTPNAVFGFDYFVSS